MLWMKRSGPLFEQGMGDIAICSMEYEWRKSRQTLLPVTVSHKIAGFLFIEATLAPCLRDFGAAKTKDSDSRAEEWLVTAAHKLSGDDWRSVPRISRYMPSHGLAE